MLSKVKEVVEKYSKSLKALIMFGSSIYSPMTARDLDIITVVDTITNVNEKTILEVEITKALKNVIVNKPIDVIVFDVESFKENLEPGALASGLIVGFKVLFNEIYVEELITKALEKIALGQYIVLKKDRKLNLSAIAKAKLKIKKIMR